MGGGEDRGEVATRLDALEVALDDISSHELPATLVVCRKREIPEYLCGPRVPEGGCIYCFRHDVEPGDTPEEIDARVREHA